MKILKKLTPHLVKALWIKAIIYLKKIRLRRRTIKIGKNVLIDFFTEIEEKVSIGNFTQIQSSKIGLGTYISEFSTLQHTKIGRFCAIADHVRAGIGSHPTKDFVSIHPAFFSTTKQAGFSFVNTNLFDELPKVENSKFTVEIGNDVWIGSGVIILDGVKIGDGAIIGANSVVTKDVESYYISVGIPAKPLRKRFNQEQIAFLKKFRWWERDFEWIKKNAYLFTDINKLIKNYSD